MMRCAYRTTYKISHGSAERSATLKTMGNRVDLVLLDVHFDIAEDRLIGLPRNATEAQLERTRREQGLQILERDAWS